MTTHPDAMSVMSAVDAAMARAHHGWRTYRAGGEHRHASLMNAIIAARSVTNVIQNLRSIDDSFDGWWSNTVPILNNPVAKWFVVVRNRIEKQGTFGDGNRVVRLNDISLDEMTRNAPAGTVSFFIGDTEGRSGWNVVREDGREEVEYFALPASTMESALHVADAPEGKSVEELFPQYLDQLTNLTRLAHQFVQSRAQDSG